MQKRDGSNSSKSIVDAELLKIYWARRKRKDIFNLKLTFQCMRRVTVWDPFWYQSRGKHHFFKKMGITDSEKCHHRTNIGTG